eukprot:COSAG01_NODE_64156_length_277_cov_1.162921_1_plen_54_part_10
MRSGANRKSDRLCAAAAVTMPTVGTAPRLFGVIAAMGALAPPAFALTTVGRTGS